MLIKWKNITLLLTLLIALWLISQSGGAFPRNIQRFLEALLRHAGEDPVLGIVLLGMIMIAIVGMLKILIRSRR